MIYVIRNNDGLYWHQGNDCEGWVEGCSRGTWYGDRYDAKQDAAKCGGDVIGHKPDLSHDPYYKSDFLFYVR
jgi:hypothetical protein